MEQKYIPGSKEEAALIIDQYFTVTQYPTTTQVEMKDGVIHRGYFQMFLNDDEIKRQFIFRFVTLANFITFREHFGDTGELDPKLMIMIEADNIKSIEALNLPGAI